MVRQQEEAMKLAPPWARVILTVLKENITALGKASCDMTTSINFNSNKGKDLEEDNVKLNKAVTSNQVAMDDMSLKFAKMEVAFKSLENRVIRQEAQAKKPNILFCGVREDGRDTWDECRVKVNNIMAHMGVQNPQNIRVDKVHRVGPPPRTPKGRVHDRDFSNQRPRPIIVSFNWQADRDRVWRAKGNLKDTSVHLEEDHPVEIDERRYRLLPVYHEAMKLPAYKARTFLIGDRLTINGEHFTVDNLDKLPKELDPRYLATRTEGDRTVFFSVNSPLSNHHPAKMTVDNVNYLCNEQYYFAQRAMAMGDDSVHCKVMKVKTPREMLREGRKARQHTDINLEKVELDIMTRGVREKFTQNPDLKAFLMATNQNFIGEASKSNPHWGTGLHLHHKNTFNKDLWATNHLGQILMRQRGRFQAQ